MNVPLTSIPYVPESAPFTPEQRAWLNGFLAGLFSQAPQEAKPASAQPTEPLLVLFGFKPVPRKGWQRKSSRRPASAVSPQPCSP